MKWFRCPVVHSFVAVGTFASDGSEAFELQAIKSTPTRSHSATVAPSETPGTQVVDLANGRSSSVLFVLPVIYVPLLVTLLPSLMG